MIVMAFLCAASLLPAQCDRASAIDVLVLGRADNAITCQIGGQMTLARLAVQPRPGERWVVKCVSGNSGNVG